LLPRSLRCSHGAGRAREGRRPPPRTRCGIVPPVNLRLARAQIRDFVLDNSGNLIYKGLPFAIAALHLPYFKDVTEGTPAIE